VILVSMIMSGLPPEVGGLRNSVRPEPSHTALCALPENVKRCTHSGRKRMPKGRVTAITATFRRCCPCRSRGIRVIGPLGTGVSFGRPHRCAADGLVDNPADLAACERSRLADNMTAHERAAAEYPSAVVPISPDERRIISWRGPVSLASLGRVGSGIMREHMDRLRVIRS
jgi:hypothetical protein